MKRLCVFASVFLFVGGLFSVKALDMIVLRDGNIIDAKVMEIHPTEIRYKRSDNLDGPMIIIPKDSVLSIKYENGVLDVINASPAVRHERDQTDGTGSYDDHQLGTPTPLQVILNTLPAISIAGNSLKFRFGGDKWTTTVNGENFSAGTVELENTNDGCILTLKQTHIWPGAVGRTAEKVANRIPGGAAVGGALNTAGRIAGATGAIEASGPEIVLEYKAGPPAKLTLLRSAAPPAAAPAGRLTAAVHPLEAVNRFDLDGFNAFAISITGIPTFWWSYGFGVTMTLFEKYKPNTFLTPSYFLSGKFISSNSDHEWVDVFSLDFGVLFKHRFPSNKVLWNLGASLELMWANCYSEYERGKFSGDAFLLGIGTQTGFSFRFNPYTSLDLNGLLKFPFGTVDMNLYDVVYYGYYGYANSANESVWPFVGGIELGLTLWFPYRSRR